MLSHLRNALSFLTRLVPPASQPETEWDRCILYFMPAGLLLGGVLTLASQVLTAFFSHLSEPFPSLLFAFFWLALEVLSTGCLHWDGLCDLGDALGSGKTDADFWQVMKDSRLGAFGAISLVLVLLGQWICLAAHCAASHWFLLVLAPAWARAAPLWLAVAQRPSCGSTLGKLVFQACGHNTRVRKLYICFFFLLPFLLALFSQRTAFLLLIPSEYLLLRWLQKKAALVGGLSGDFFGACIELSQLLFLLVSL